MKRIMVFFLALILSFLVFQNLDNSIYSERVPLLNSLRIYKTGDGTDYIFVYELSGEKIGEEVDGARIFLHGTPVKDEMKLLPSGRKKHGFDNWDFTVKLQNDNFFIRKISSEALNYSQFGMGIYIKPDGERIKVRSSIVLSKIDLSEARYIDEIIDLKSLPATELSFSKGTLQSLQTYSLYEVFKIKILVIVSLFVGFYPFFNLLIKRKQNVIDGILILPGIFFILAGLRPGTELGIASLYCLFYVLVMWFEGADLEAKKNSMTIMVVIAVTLIAQTIPIAGEEEKFYMGNVIGIIIVILISIFGNKKQKIGVKDA